MPQAKFVLKEPTAQSETLIYLLFRYANLRLKYSTGEKIHPKLWNAKKQRAKETAAFIFHSEFNTRLNNIESAVQDSYRKLINDKIEPTPEKLKERLNKAITSKPQKKKQTFIDFAEAFINEVIDNRRKGSIQIYRATTVKMLVEFSKAKKYKVDFETITLNFYNEFTSYLIEKGLVTNTVGKYIKTIKSFLNEATERGLNTNLEFKSKKFKRVQEDINHVYLNLEELKLIEELDLSDKKYLDRVRDMFLIGCFTGLRFSDFTQLRKEDFVKVGHKQVIKIRTIKTNEDVVIPVSNLVGRILKKYEGELPRAISNQKMNEYLKEICEMAGLKEKAEIKRTSGNNIISQNCPKWQLISSHTARRSFATNAYKATKSSIGIMKITGHRTVRAFLKYIKISKEENAALLSDHDFFK